MCELPNYECYPLKSLSELLDWNPSESDSRASKTIAPLVQHQTKEGPRVLLCHDMKGGYLADKYLHGCQDQDAYRFFHWSQIDLFVYFSHYLVTIPPVPWITAGHRNGVPVLGTIITEGLDGFNTIKQLLSSPEMADKVVAQLSRLMRFFQFDGWLLNIENEVDDIPGLFKFIDDLKMACKQVDPLSQLIWYDSIIHEPNLNCLRGLSLVESNDLVTNDRTINSNCAGKLLWQNELNESNCSFFERCDGIFLNYAWDDRTLNKSRQVAESVRRPLDVYVGVDVFGRGCFGGGGMQTNKAIDKISEHHMSIALFAPGWVHENLTDLNQFTQLEYDFWSRLKLPDRHVPCRLPFTSSFCQGFGTAYFHKGFRLKKGAWHNLHLQQVQPNHRCGRIYVHDAYEGGGCLQMHSFDHSLLECSIRITGRCFITIVYKRLDQETTSDTSTSGASLLEEQDPFVRLQQQLNSAADRARNKRSLESDLDVQLKGTSSLSTRTIEPGEVSKDVDLHRHLQSLEVTLLPINGWHSRCFEIRSSNDSSSVLHQVFVRPPIDLHQDALLIGKFTVSCLNESD